MEEMMVCGFKIKSHKAFEVILAGSLGSLILGNLADILLGP